MYKLFTCKESACNAGDPGFLGWKDALEKGMATHCSILTWRIPWTKAGFSPWGHKESDMTEQLTLSFSCHWKWFIFSKYKLTMLYNTASFI